MDQNQTGDPARAQQWASFNSALTRARGAVIDIIEGEAHAPEDRDSMGASVHMPTAIVINGHGVLLPAETKIDVETATGDATQVTMTMFARRVRIARWDELEGDLTAYVPGLETKSP